MFVSLNRKIIYTILGLFLATSIIFVYTFYLVYGNKIQADQLASIQRNQQYIDLLFRNINMSREIQNILTENPQIKLKDSSLKNFYWGTSEEERIKQLNQEQKKIADMRKIYDQRYNAIHESLKILAISSILIIIAIISLGLLIRRWVLNPINKISIVSSEVSNGNLNVRIATNSGTYFKDELDNLIITFNQMLSNMQHNISEIKNNEAFLQSLVDSIPDGIRVLDKHYNIILANKAYYRQVGISQKKCLKCYQASQKASEPCNPETIQCPIREIFYNHKKSLNVIHQFSAYPQRHLSINAAPLNAGKKQYIIEAIHDLSEDINFSHQQKLSSLGFLSTSIAHEIKNHLGALRMILERLIEKFYADKDDNCEEKKNLMMIYNELVSSIAVPERLLKLSRSVTDTSHEVNIKDSIEDAVNLLDFEAKSKGININIVAPLKEIIIKGNDADFKMVVINIILNAIKAMGNNGVLTITIKQDKKKNVLISFNDTGIGIAPDKINRIFDPFYSGDNASDKKGSGLGLSIAKSIVEKSGGKISVSSTLGAGSCFTVSFPAIKTIAKK